MRALHSDKSESHKDARVRRGSMLLLGAASLPILQLSPLGGQSLRVVATSSTDALPGPSGSTFIKKKKKK